MEYENTDLETVVASGGFRRLTDLSPEADPFRLYGIASDECAHSRILAELLGTDGPFGHLSARLLEGIAACLEASGEASRLPPGVLGKFRSAHFQAHVERSCDAGCGDESLGRMDILLEDPVRELAVVVENKIWAREQSRQVERYQTWLARKRSGWSSFVLFLTPSGAAPETASRDASFAVCLSLGYAGLLCALDGVRDQDATGIVEGLRRNIRRNIVGECPEKELVQEMLADPKLAKALLAVMRNMPKLEDIEEKLVKGVCRITELSRQALEVETYPGRGDVREIKIRIVPWCDAGVHICFNFYQGDDWPTLRTMLHVDDWERSRSALRRLAEAYPDIISFECPVRYDWNVWRLVMADEGDDDASWEGTYVEDRSYTQATADRLLALFKERYGRLKPAMDWWLARV